ncbi:MAG: DUF2249 domain-containing protein [Alphaproteobacteria bacterium]|nr:DUF2249 domain-containing protein [Alphaproteobacteria bacterium]
MTVELTAPNWQAEDGHHIDVRNLPPPEPMLQILALLQSIESGDVIVHHHREPIYLYPELAERGWKHEIIEDATGSGGEIRLRLWPD